MFKVSLSFLAFTLSFLVPQAGLASTKVTNVIVKRSATGVSVDLTFDRAVAARILKPSLERNFVQFVLKGMKIDAARMIPVVESEVQKIFIYPYNTDTARLRIIFKHDGQSAKGRVSLWNNNAKSVRVFIKDPEALASANHEPAVRPLPAPAKPTARTAAAAATPTPAVPASAIAQAIAPAADGTTEEKNILKEVVANTHDIDINNPDSVKAALRAPEKLSDNKSLSAIDKSEEKGPVGISADPTRHFGRMAIALFGVLALFIGGVLVVKRYAGKIKTLPFGKKERLIQVVATHYLGNKNSISLVKITNEYMVVGVSNDGISLISKLGPEVNVESYIEDRFWNGTFEKHLDKFAKDPKASKEIDLSTYDGARDLAAPAEQIAKRVEDKVELSPLRASIKEKLTKLKPLA